jgi:hypothetical protein
MTVAAAEKRSTGHLLLRMAPRPQSFRRPNMISIRLRRLYRLLPYLTDRSRDLRLRGQGSIPFVGKAHLNQSASYPRLPKSALLADRPAALSNRCGRRLASGYEEAERAAVSVGDSMKLRVHDAFRAPDQPPKIRSSPQARCRAGCLQIGWVDHDGHRTDTYGLHPSIMWRKAPIPL